ncbi:aldolase [Laetiporus sulphureus 93-53]|uniref:Aldolase n=1 Tax=Laetiporus sulphureus 93-53 TaxID=1314785 RepID=A0A165BC82_9APHY|nr:aldolase [Laetiporus sulphureus 93-53]KZT00719.1 aldolase [Laetiporus sulphureus 93-53]
MLDSNSGPHYTFVDPSWSDHCDVMVAQALRLLTIFEKRGADRDRVIISIPATDAGIQAARQLEQDHLVPTRLLLVSTASQAVTCVEAGVCSLNVSYEALAQTCASAYRGKLMCNATQLIQGIINLKREHRSEMRVYVTDLTNMEVLHLLHGIDGITLRQDLSEQAQRQSVIISHTPSTDNASGVTSSLPARNSILEREITNRTLDVGLRQMIQHLNIVKKQLGCLLFRRHRMARSTHYQFRMQHSDDFIGDVDMEISFQLELRFNGLAFAAARSDARIQHKGFSEAVYQRYGVEGHRIGEVVEAKYASLVREVENKPDSETQYPDDVAVSLEPTEPASDRE